MTVETDFVVSAEHVVEEQSQEAITAAKQKSSPIAAISSRVNEQKSSPIAQPSSRVNEDDDDEAEHADEHGIVKLPISSFTRRIDRATKKTLRELFGTDNRADILTMKKELDTHRTEKEEERRKSLAEIERIKEDMTKERAAREAAETHALEIENEYLADRQDIAFQEVASEYIQERYYKHAALELRDYLLERHEHNGYKNVTNKEIAAFFAKYAEENAEVATAPAEPQQRRAVTNGSTSPRPAPSANPATTKDPRPGRPNSMSSAEFQAYLRSRGISY